MKKSAVTTGSSRAMAQRRSAPTSRPIQPSDPAESPDGVQERIAKKAYELWEQRGRREGKALDDWLDAQASVMGEIHEARE